jgi:hypothetical protein
MWVGLWHEEWGPCKNIKSHKLMKDSRFYKIFTSSTFNKLIQYANNNDAPLNSLIDSTVSPKVKIAKRVGVHSIACDISKVEGCAGILGWGLRRETSESIIYIDLHKLNYKLVSA